MEIMEEYNLNKLIAELTQFRNRNINDKNSTIIREDELRYLLAGCRTG